MPAPRLDAINPNEVLLYLGYKSGAVPAQVEEQIAACSEAILQAARPRAVWCALPLEGTAVPAAGLTLEGEDMKALLSGCHEAVFLAATLGPEVEQLLRRAEVVDMAQALTLDAVASAAIEAVCDNLEADLRQEYGEKGLYLTDRFSPGYGDLPLAQQKDFCALLDTQRRIGVTLSGSYIMVPRKSVTAVMGVSPTPKPWRARGCQHCSLFRSCPYRHDGRNCGNA
ncbi:MAG: vitamin B12 dependent methionine synthase, activation domain protein [Clostridiales bacterium]|nr:vitamin B12 dependent methionine synthase, activation domain protein [Clostridiales bacterium]